MDDRTAPDPSPEMIASDPKDAHRRLIFRMRQGWGRLRSAPIQDDPLWTKSMALVFLAFVVTTIVLLALDSEINAAVRAADTPVRQFLIDWTDIARSQWYLVPAGLIVLVAGAWDWGHAESSARRVWAHFYGQAIFVFVSVAGALMLTNLLKMLFGRARPPLIDDGGALNFVWLTIGHDFASFPSGHSTTAGAVTMILILWLPRCRWLFIAIGLLLGASRSAAEAHYPSDISAGLAIGLFFTLTLARFLAIRNIAFLLAPGTVFPRPRRRWLGTLR